MRFITFFILENSLSRLGEAIRLFWHHIRLVNTASFHFVLLLTRKKHLVILSPLVILPCVEVQKKVEGDHKHFHLGHVDKLIDKNHEYIYVYVLMNVCVTYTHGQHIHIHVNICIQQLPSCTEFFKEILPFSLLHTIRIN